MHIAVVADHIYIKTQYLRKRSGISVRHSSLAGRWHVISRSGANIFHDETYLRIIDAEEHHLCARVSIIRIKELKVLIIAHKWTHSRRTSP